ncbi:MAG TPA: HIRAN domain-containing protein [Gemmatimonadales bacterium]|nr:HIRAN domain-containing protein [Gemmatimonadales bacterium]
MSAQVASIPVAAPPATTIRATSASIDDDPSDVLRRVQSEMVSANLDLPLDEQVEVVGEQYHPKEIRKLFRECSLPITTAGNVLEDEVCYLVPEPWNPHDPNAVAVMVRSYQVGHLPAELAKRYHPRLIGYAQQRQLVTGVARVWSKLESGAMVRARVTIAVPEVAVLLAQRRAQLALPVAR